MSYARFGPKSDVYIYPAEKYICCGCRITPDTKDYGYTEFSCDTSEEILAHAKAHRKAGYKVPIKVFTRLKAEAGNPFFVFYHYGWWRKIWYKVLCPFDVLSGLIEPLQAKRERKIFQRYVEQGKKNRELYGDSVVPRKRNVFYGGVKSRGER